MNSKLKNDIQRLLTPTGHMEHLHQLFTLLLNLFHKYNIFTLAMSGTLLGIVRNHNYILWDDDVDMAVNFTDYTRIMDLNTILNPLDIEISNQGYPWVTGEKWRVLKFRYINKPFIFIDLFPFEFKGHTYSMTPMGMVPKDWYRRNVFKLNELYPLQLMKLRDLWVPCPNDPLGFINRSYGKESLDTCIITHQHLQQPNKGVLKNWEQSLEQFAGLGVYGKKFPCGLIPADTLPLSPKIRLNWLHWFILGGGLFLGWMLMVFIINTRKGG